MPQKRNPVALEHARALGSKALGQAQAILTAVHNTPFGDIVDTEDDLQPLVFAMFRDATRAVKLVAAAMASATFDAKRLEACAAAGWTTLTELADTMVRDHGLSFRAAHAIAARVMAASQHEPARRLAELTTEAAREIVNRPVEYTESQLAEILSPRHFVEIRRTWGGPAPEEAGRAAKASWAALEVDEAWCANATNALAEAERRLVERSARL
jgi:argininosuccinate lyase